jgi:hypothetical protein
VFVCSQVFVSLPYAFVPMLWNRMQTVLLMLSPIHLSDIQLSAFVVVAAVALFIIFMAGVMLVLFCHF